MLDGKTTMKRLHKNWLSVSFTAGILILQFLSNYALPRPAVSNEQSGASKQKLTTAKSQAKGVRNRSTNEAESPFDVTFAYNKATLDKVDELVRQKFWNPKILPVWTKTIAESRSKILAAKTLIQLDTRINDVLRCLNASHTQFLTLNDESFYLLHCLFAQGDTSIKPRIIDFTGIAAGIDKKHLNIIRYVLDHSPAFRAGIKGGDEILSVNGQPFQGEINFWGTSGKPVNLVLRREGKVFHYSLTPGKVNLYSAYVQAIEDSVRVFKSGNNNIGYIHYWIGAEPAHDALESALTQKLALSDGLILDLRDGYGAAWINDLDYFFRPENAYPQDMRYGKPLVVLINGGTRSGKEALAASLKRSGRARLVGTRTAGAFLKGRIFDLDNRTSLYLAVHDGDFLGTRLEAIGVQPDIEIPGQQSEDSTKDPQFDKAVQILQEMLSGGDTFHGAS